MAKFCGKCGTGIPVGDGFCPNCGAMVSMETVVPQVVSTVPIVEEVVENKANKFGNIKGHISLALMLFWFFVIRSELLYDDLGFIIFLGAPIASLIFGIIGVRQKDCSKGTAIAGLVISSLLIAFLVVGTAYGMGNDTGYKEGYESGYEVPWYEKILD